MIKNRHAPRWYIVLGDHWLNVRGVSHVTLRSMATIAAQCYNGWEFGLQHQIRVGLSLGMSPQKVKGIFLQLIFYAGIPATVSSLAQAQRVINEQPMWVAEDVEPLQAD